MPTTKQKEGALKLMARLNWMRNTCKPFVTRSGKTAFWLFVGASVGLCLGIGPGTAAVQTSAAPDVGRLKLDFIYPNLSSDQDLGRTSSRPREHR